MRLCGSTRFVVKRSGSSNWRFSGGREVTWSDREGLLPRLYPLPSTHRSRYQMCHTCSDNDAHPAGTADQNG